jgi:tetratricopeptide (TPR) repeat protein
LRSRRRTTQLLFVVVLISLPIVSQAQSTRSRNAEQQALQLFQRSEEAYRAGQFAEAAQMLHKAYALHATPILLYNLARALEGSGDLAGALAAYEQYLVEDRSPSDRGAIDKRMATLRAQIAERDALLRERGAAENARKEAEARLEQTTREEAAARAAQAAIPPPPPRVLAPWLVVGGGLVVVGGGGLLSGLAISRHDRAVDASQVTAPELQNSARHLALAANVCFGIGGALSLAGGIWGIVKERRRAREIEARNHALAAVRP